MNDVLSRYESAVDTFDRVIHQVPDDRWSASTPCSEWDVRALVNHVVGEMAWVTPLLAGRTVPDVGDELAGDLLGADPCAAWHHHSGQAHGAFAEPAALERTVHLSYGDDSAASYCDQLTFDALVHAWDLARASDVDDALPADLVTWAIEWFTPVLPLYQQAGMVADTVVVPVDADAQTRLLAMTGRRGD